jgi:hypothetical protein
MPLARADLESLLRARRLDRTLTSALPCPDPFDEAAVAPTGITALDARLSGGFPRGQLSELAGPRSSARASLTLQLLAAATRRGELTAVVDALDMFDPPSAAAAGVDLDRLLWIRGHVVVNPGMCRDVNQRALEQAIKALTLVLQAGNFGLVVFDAAEAPVMALKRLPFTTWLRLQRMIEGSQTVCVLVGPEPMARSSAGLSVKLGTRDSGFGIRSDAAIRSETATCSDTGTCSEAGIRQTDDGSRQTPRLFEGFERRAQIVRARAREEAAVAIRTAAAHHVC